MKSSELVLHGLAIKKHADAAAVAQITALAEKVAKQELDEAVAKGRVLRIGSEYVLKPAAQVILKTNYATLFRNQRENSRMQEAYAEFEAINEQLKQLMTDWQTTTIGGNTVVNDHGDNDYDNRIIDRLGKLHDRSEPIFAKFEEGLPRLSIYSALLEEALEKAEDGDLKWVSDVHCMSYHTTWFEFHEDILRVLGRTRAE